MMRSRNGSAAPLALLSLMASLALGTAGCGSSLVGADCNDGTHLLCGQVCVAFLTNERHCGACGNVCDIGALCIAGECVDQDGTDAGPDLDAGDVDAGTSDAGAAEDAGAMEDAGPVASCACDVGELCCGGTCVRPDSDLMHCGQCDMACTGGEVCSDGSCEASCAGGLTACASTSSCHDTDTDPNHCDACDAPCASGRCVAGACQSDTSGHVVLIGHDYQSTNASMTQVLQNALFLSAADPLRVLVFEGESGSSAQAGINTTLDGIASGGGRTITRTATSDLEQVTVGLADADVFLVHPQQGSDDASIRALGERWASALETFVDGGGVVIVLDAGGNHDGTHQLLGEAGLLMASGRTNESGQLVTVVAGGDALASGLGADYLALTASAYFATSEGTQVVARCPTGAPTCSGATVVHLVTTP